MDTLSLTLIPPDREHVLPDPTTSRRGLERDVHENNSEFDVKITVRPGRLTIDQRVDEFPRIERL